MQIEQVTILAFLILGIISGVISAYADTVIAVLAAFSIYAVATTILFRFAKSKRMKILVTNGLVTFFPVWLIVWIFLFNLR